MPLDNARLWLEVGTLLINVEHVVWVEEKSEGSIIEAQYGAEIHAPGLPIETIQSLMSQRALVVRVGIYLLNIDHLIMLSENKAGPGCMAFMSGGVHVALPDITYEQGRALLGLRVDTTETAPEDSN